jgi:hypothetical protein
MRRRKLWKCFAVKRSIGIILLSSLAALGAEPVAALWPRAWALEIAGIYRRSRDASSILEVKAEGGRFLALLSGGAPSGAGAGGPADCYVRAVGKLHGKTLEGEFAAVEMPSFSYSRAAAEKERRKLKIVFGPNTAEVVEADTFGYCGLGAGFLGRYQKAAR